MTHRRKTLWPTNGATLMVRSFLIRVTNSSKVSQSQTTPSSKALNGISSIWLNMPTNFIRWSALSGASDREQLPGTIVVTPCSMAGLAAPSHNNCASKCVCGSMKPGDTILPRASISVVPVSATLPTLTMRPSLIAISPKYDGKPLPSTMFPFLITKSIIKLLANRPLQYRL